MINREQAELKAQEEQQAAAAQIQQQQPQHVQASMTSLVTHTVAQ